MSNRLARLIVIGLALIYAEQFLLAAHTALQVALAH